MKVFTLAYECVWAVNVEMCHGCVCLPNGCYLAPDCRGTQPIQHHKRYDVLPSSFIALPHSTVQLCDTERENNNEYNNRQRPSICGARCGVSEHACLCAPDVCMPKQNGQKLICSISVGEFRFLLLNNLLSYYQDLSIYFIYTINTYPLLCECRVCACVDGDIVTSCSWQNEWWPWRCECLLVAYANSYVQRRRDATFTWWLRCTACDFGMTESFSFVRKS